LKKRKMERTGFGSRNDGGLQKGVRKGKKGSSGSIVGVKKGKRKKKERIGECHGKLQESKREIGGAQIEKEGVEGERFLLKRERGGRSFSRKRYMRVGVGENTKT